MAEQQKATDQHPSNGHGAVQTEGVTGSHQNWRRGKERHILAGCKVWYWLLGDMGTGSSVMGKAMFAPVCRIQGLAKTATAGSVQHSPNSALHRVRVVQPALLQLSSALRTLGKRLEGAKGVVKSSNWCTAVYLGLDLVKLIGFTPGGPLEGQCKGFLLLCVTFGSAQWYLIMCGLQLCSSCTPAAELTVSLAAG